MKKSLKITFLAAVILIITMLSSVCLAADGKISLEAFNTADGIRVEWNECDGAYYYEVYRQTGKKGKKLLLSKVQSTFYEDTASVEGKTYSYTVIPVFADYSVAKASDAVEAYRLSGVKVKKGSSQRNGIYIKWKGVEKAKGYRVYRKSAADSEWETVAELGAGKSSYLDEKVSPGHTYTYCVKPFNGEYEGAAVNEKQLCYISYPEVKGIDITQGGVKLTWEGTDDAAYYYVYRKAGSDGSFKAIALLDSTYTEYVDADAVSGELCTYYICAADVGGNKGSFDKEVSVKYIKKSEIVRAVSSSKGVSLYWSKSEGCRGYTIYRKALGEKEWKLRGTVYGEDRLSAIDSKVENQKVYLYTVRAFKDKNLAVYDEEGVSIRFYSAPVGLKVKASEEKGKIISWDKVDGVNSYAVYRKKGDSWTFLGLTTENKFTDKSAKSGKKYTYGVAAYEGSVLKSAVAEITSK